MRFDPALKGVVRRYSLIVAEARPEDTLCQALGVAAQQDEEAEQKKRDEPDIWRRWLQFNEPSR